MFMMHEVGRHLKEKPAATSAGPGNGARRQARMARIDDQADNVFLQIDEKDIKQ